MWSLPDPGSVRGLRDLALDRGPVASHTLYGTEVPAEVIRARMLATPRIVAVRDPAGQPLDATPGEAVKRRTLAAHFVECGTRRVRGARITVFARPGRCPGRVFRIRSGQPAASGAVHRKAEEGVHAEHRRLTRTPRGAVPGVAGPA
ncbi:hypothetical protein GCM10023335_34450 [Streptomyces siamensis]|uniref:Uncharacterized protein n=1 Tax=Streptomyces siamensis TaxID=1274986 RepID=A0ABP9IW44_9ACTN